MNQNLKADPVEITKDYYNSQDADNFYFNVWGGQDIHIGIYDTTEGSIRDASRRTIYFMENLLTNLKEGSRILDLGSGYGGAARYLAGKYACHVTCLNLSLVQNERNRKANIEKKLEEWITVEEGNFEKIQYPDHSFDIVWSQDAILHSDKKNNVFSEVFRVLKDGGEFVFTDPMQTENCPDGVLRPVLDRIRLKSLGCPIVYLQMAQEAGFEKQKYVDLSSQLIIHYSRVLADLLERKQKILSFCGREYVEKMVEGLQHWINAGQKGYLKWGAFYFMKPFDSHKK